MTINGIEYNAGAEALQVPQSPVQKSKRGKVSPFKSSVDAMLDASPAASHGGKSRRKSEA